MNIPSATYRIQFQPEFTFESADEIVPYLCNLGVSHIYASPILQAKKGSQHGYDVVDPTQINPELGGIEKFKYLIENAKIYNISWIQDIVPNHMAFESENKMLMDVFERGEASQFFKFFDIEWDHPYNNLKGRTLTPFLGEYYGTCLEKGEITLEIGEDGFFIKYYDYKLPVSLMTYPKILHICLEKAKKKGKPSDTCENIGQILKPFEELSSDIGNEEKVSLVKSALWQKYTSDKAVKNIIDHYLEHLNNGKNESLDELHKLISEQLFRLSFWKVGNDELNYRRFFTINSLICLKTEDMDVFNYIHAQTFNFINEGLIDGLRVDHVDGLFVPLIYLRRLRDIVQDKYVTVEKIICENEEMPVSWPIQGSTGYDFMNYLNGIFVDTDAGLAIEKIYNSFSGRRYDFDSLVAEKKRLFMEMYMAGDIDNLAQHLRSIFSGNPYGSDFTMYGLRKALVEIMANFPIYRTYVSELGISDSDRFYIKKALEKARHTGKDLLYELNAIEKVFLLEYDLIMNDKHKESCRNFTRRFQQFSGTLMAKGAEDTAYYIYNRLISLNEVGGFPAKFGVSADEFHNFNIKRQKTWPHSMNATATHDTKRGEDSRARINVISEIPTEWQKALKLWHKINRRYKTKVDNDLTPSNNDEYFIYQTILGSYPFSYEEMDAYKERLKQYIIKAVREAKIHTAWLKPDTRYEEGCVKFIEYILNPSENNQFLKDFFFIQKKVANFGIFNSLSQTLLKMTSPGVPDIYQGTELWDFSFVDPDNRRPVDFNKRKNILDEIRIREGDLTNLIRDLTEHKEDGRIKLFTLHRLLETRKQYKDLFENGEYIPLNIEGKYKKNIIAFVRQNDNSSCIAIAPRLLTKVIKENELPLGTEIWQDTVVLLPEGLPLDWENVFTGQSFRQENNINIGDVLNIFPIVCLITKK